jgi:uncharacterized protein (TIGR00266 family)
MKFQIDGNPDFGDLTVQLAPGDTILCESGAMSRMTTALDVNSRLLGGFVRASVRKLFGGESFFVGEYSAPNGGFVALAPSMPGTVLHRRLDGDAIHLTAGSFLACTPGVELRTRFGGLRSFFSGEGAFFLECTGQGDLFYNAYGGVVEKTIDGEFIVDTGHLVAWEPSLTYKIGGMGGIKQTLFSGEGLVMRFSGRGKLWVQTRHLAGVAGWLIPYLR